MRTHGLASTYHHGCRCDACTEARRKLGAEERAREGPKFDKRLPKDVRAYLETEPEFFRP